MRVRNNWEGGSNMRVVPVVAVVGPPPIITLYTKLAGGEGFYSRKSFSTQYLHILSQFGRKIEEREPPHPTQTHPPCYFGIESTSCILD